jgi:hypothetical protein
VVVAVLALLDMEQVVVVLHVLKARRTGGGSGVAAWVGGRGRWCAQAHVLAL